VFVIALLPVRYFRIALVDKVMHPRAERTRQTTLRCQGWPSSDQAPFGLCMVGQPDLQNRRPIGGQPRRVGPQSTALGSSIPYSFWQALPNSAGVRFFSVECMPGIG